MEVRFVLKDGVLRTVYLAYIPLGAYNETIYLLLHGGVLIVCSVGWKQ